MWWWYCQSLYRTKVVWLFTLPPKYSNNWKEMEAHFYKHFYKTDLEVKLVDLDIIVQDLGKFIKN
jgi:hypothetical protein